MNISPKSIEEVKAAIRIEEVVQDFVNLKPAGTRFKGLCPFHHEKTPSFVVSPDRNMFKCFGCGEGGDAISFLQKHEKFSYLEAIEWLANKYGIQLEKRQLTPEDQARYKEEESLYIINDFAQQFFVRQLTATTEGRNLALTYFKERGIRQESIEKFGLGYAPAAGDAFLQAAKNNSYNLESLIKLGLITKNGTRDFFQGRVMFPIRSLSGKVLAFAGRTMAQDKKTPKYINSPETDIYNKRKVLYGIYESKKAIRKADECLLVEGYTDVISLHQNGIENVVASSGTALTEDQLLLIKRNTDNLTILYDGDAAGIHAALKGLDLALAQGLNVKLVLLPEGEDPDSYVRSVGSTQFAEYIATRARDFVLFKLERLRQQAADPVRRSALIKDLVHSIAHIPDPIKQSAYLKQVAGELDIREEILAGELARAARQLLRQKRHATPHPVSDRPEPADTPPTGLTATRTESVDEKHTLEREVVRVLVQHGDKHIESEGKSVAAFMVEKLGVFFEDFKEEPEPLRQMVLLARDRVKRNRTVNFDFFNNQADDKIREMAQQIVNPRFEMSENWEKRLNMPLRTQAPPERNYYRDCQIVSKRFQLFVLKKVLQQNTNQIKNMSTANAEEMKKALYTHKKIREAVQRLTSDLRQVTLDI